jgi:23S rRNA pseudouridine1911/1915/1917 synthase
MESRWCPENSIVEENDQFLVVYKPAGLAVQNRKASREDLEHLLLNYLSGKGGQTRNGIPFLSVIHRLDQPVEGLLVFARTEEAAAELSRQIRENRMEKEYLAVAEGIPARPEGRLTDWLLKDGRTNTSAVVEREIRGAKKAILEYTCLKQLPEGRSLLRIRLLTGRHHQIRVQLAHAGMPLAGDRKYNPKAGREQKETPALCACRLSFFHPQTGEKLTYQVSPRGGMVSK